MEFDGCGVAERVEDAAVRLKTGKGKTEIGEAGGAVEFEVAQWSMLLVEEEFFAAGGGVDGVHQFGAGG